MSYLCSRCEADGHPNMELGQIRNAFEQKENRTATLYCYSCSSNAIHFHDTAESLLTQ